MTAPQAITHEEAVERLNEAASLLQDVVQSCLKNDNTAVGYDVFNAVYEWLEKEDLAPVYNATELGLLELERIRIERQIDRLQDR